MKIQELLEAVAPAEKEAIWQMEVPFAYDDHDNEEPTTFAAKFAKRFKVHHKMTQAHGPSGGWPEFLFWGPRSNMEKFARAYSKGAELSKEEELEGLEKSRKKYDASKFGVKVTEAKSDTEEADVSKVLAAVNAIIGGNGRTVKDIHECGVDTVAFSVLYDFPESFVKGSEVKAAGKPTVKSVSAEKGEMWRDGEFGADYEITLKTPMFPEDARTVRAALKKRQR